MKTYKELLAESPQIGMTKKAYASLSSEARQAIDAWETAGWVGGALEKHFLANDHVAQEIETAFAPIRKILPARVKLYRGIVHDSSSTSYKTRHLESWTDDKRVAEHFAGLREVEHQEKGVKWRSNLYGEFTDAEIKKAVATYNKSGFVSFNGKKYVKNKDDPAYYNVFSKSNQFITDGDDLETELRSNNQSAKDSNKDKIEKGTVIESMISRDKIIWITNNNHSKEYIVYIH